MIRTLRPTTKETSCNRRFEGQYPGKYVPGGGANYPKVDGLKSCRVRNERYSNEKLNEAELHLDERCFEISSCGLFGRELCSRMVNGKRARNGQEGPAIYSSSFAIPFDIDE